MVGEEANIPTQFTRSIKLSDTAKGVRIDVHVWANDSKTAISEAMKMYNDMKAELTLNNVPIAPMEGI